MSPFNALLAACFAATLTFDLCQGHGRLLQPLGRKSMFRMFPYQSWEPTWDNDYGANIPEGAIYRRSGDDMSVRCGGVAQGWPRRCGVCGDHPDEVEQPNMAGGTWAPLDRAVAATYTSGQSIEVTVEITSPHGGSFQFDLCENNNLRARATESCFTRHLNLSIADPATGWSGHDWQLGSRGAGKVWLVVSLPAGVSCSQCILRWNYITGNSKQYDAHQEMFRQCSDITINPSEGETKDAEEAETTANVGTTEDEESDLPPWMIEIGEEADDDELFDEIDDLAEKLDEDDNGAIVDGYWLAWGAWSSCSVSCGDGWKSRRRVCVPPKNGGKPCVGYPAEGEVCMDIHCPVHGGWSSWSSWGSCSASCGDGTRSRSRACNNPVARYGGRPCGGADSENLACSGQACPDDDQYKVIDGYMRIPGHDHGVHQDYCVMVKEIYVAHASSIRIFSKFCYNYCLNPIYNEVAKNNSACMNVTSGVCKLCPADDWLESEELFETEDDIEEKPDEITIEFADNQEEKYNKMRYDGGAPGRATCCYVHHLWAQHGANAPRWCGNQACVDRKQLRPGGQWPCLEHTSSYCANCWHCD